MLDAEVLAGTCGGVGCLKMEARQGHSGKGDRKLVSCL